MAQVLNQQQPKVAIIGAGCAGLAAASLLVSRGIDITVFEAAPQLGGRARGLDYKGLTLDNGQHILLGAYSETLKLLKHIGVDVNQALHRMPLAMHVHHLAQQSAVHLNTCQYLPAPLHLLFGLLFAKGLSRQDKYAAIRFMAVQHLRKFKLAQDIPLADFLLQQQTPTLIQSLWEPLCLAALNTPLKQASSQVFLNVLRDSFTQKKTDSDFLLPKQDLSTLLATPMRQSIEAHGGKIVHETVQSIQTTQNGFTLHSLDAEHHFSHVIVAVGPHQLSQVLPAQLAATQQVAHFTYQPITTVYLQYAATQRLPNAMQGCVGSVSQWVFDRGQLYQQHGLIAVIISASGQHQTLTQAALAQCVTEELSALFPELGQPLWHKVITEKRATFSCDAGLQRPSQVTSLPHLYLAGDYTAGDYPATIEGAVRSGVKAAELVLKSLQLS